MNCPCNVIVIFDQEYKNLADLIAKTQRWFPMFGDGAKFLSSASDLCWVWPTGERLEFRVMRTPDDYWKYHGQEYAFIGWNELTKHPTSETFDLSESLNRTSFIPALHSPDPAEPLPDIPLVVLATTNPYGVGHNWVKRKFIDAARPGEVVRTETEIFNPRIQAREVVTRTQVRIFGSYRENVYLPPEYIAGLEGIKDPNRRRAWLEGDWDITSGGMFDDIWDSDQNIVEPFQVPHSWRILRAFDWGSSAPFSVGWWAISDGSARRGPNGDQVPTVRGDLFRIAEWYGWESGEPNKGLKLLAGQIAQGIIEREVKMDIAERVQPGPADASIFDKVNGNCIAEDMGNPVDVMGVKYHGPSFSASNKTPGSRINGHELMRQAMYNAHRTESGVPREAAGLFVFSNCQDGFIRTVPGAPRDKKNPDDVDTTSEDHVVDETRYVILDHSDIIKVSSSYGTH